MILSMHLPKTGGSTFQDLLIRAFHDKVYFVYDETVLSPYYKFNQYIKFISGKRIDPPNDVVCIHGHFRATRFDRMFPNANLITWFRDPVERVLSLYYYWVRLRNTKITHPSYKELVQKKFDLIEFIKIKSLRNIYLTYLDSKQLTSFCFIGITEEYDKSIKLFLRMFNIEENEVIIDSQNKNPDKDGDKYCIDKKLRALIMKYHEEDIALYNEAKRRFEELCQIYGV